MGIPHVAGRDFADVRHGGRDARRDRQRRARAGSSSPMETRSAGASASTSTHANGKDDMEWTVVGVVGNIKSSLDGPVRQTIFVPRTQRPGTGMHARSARAAGSGAARGQRDASRARDGSGSAGRSPHARRGRWRHDRASARDFGAGRRVRARRAGARGGWRLRRDGVFGEAADAGDRRPHGARRDRARGASGSCLARRCASSPSASSSG